MDAERDALVALYRATNGDAWKRATGWCTSAPLSEWYGVKVSDGRVVELNLICNDLRGLIPKEVGQLGALTTLNLSKNYLEGSIPKEVGQLGALTTLDLNSNRLKGSIPKELGQLGALESLALSYNKLEVSNGRYIGSDSILCYVRGIPPQCTAKLAAMPHLDGITATTLAGKAHNEEISKIQTTNAIGTIPVEVLDINTLRYVDCKNNRISGLSFIESAGERERLRQILRGQANDGLNHSWALRLVESLVSLWHFCLPVLDDATDLWLLVETSGRTHRGLWWTCLIVYIVADIERLYTGFFFIVLNVSIVLGLIAEHCCGWVGLDCCGIISLLAFWQEIDFDIASWLWWDSLLWTLFGSRARSSPFMGLFGMAGLSRGADMSSTGLGLHGIDVIVFYHPFRYLGEFIMSFPRGNRRDDVTSLGRALRRDISMVRAVGETLLVDPLFLALSVVSGGWDENVTGFVWWSALFSMLELVTELQYYVSQAEAGTSATHTVVAQEDIEGGNRTSGNPAPRPVESSVPIIF